MRKALLIAALLAAPLGAQQPAKPALSPNEIVTAAPRADWTAIAPSDLLVMDLAADAKGKPRRVVIQLMPAPFSQGWVGNIRRLAKAHWWDGLAVVRVQDNYVAQWGDPDGEDKAKARALPEGLAVVPESQYFVQFAKMELKGLDADSVAIYLAESQGAKPRLFGKPVISGEPYLAMAMFHRGWPVSSGHVPDVSGNDIFAGRNLVWPVHCYGMVGVGRDMPPNTGSGAELYTVIGHAPRHLDRNIALVGRVIEGIEHLSSLPRGTGALGFYEKPEERTTIRSVRLGSETESDPRPAFEYLSTESKSFAAYAEARANRRDAFFIRQAGGTDICNIPVPVRRVK